MRCKRHFAKIAVGIRDYRMIMQPTSGINDNKYNKYQPNLNLILNILFEKQDVC